MLFRSKSDTKSINCELFLGNRNTFLRKINIPSIDFNIITDINETIDKTNHVAFYSEQKTNIAYLSLSIWKNSNVMINLYSLKGDSKTIFNSNLNAGVHIIEIETQDLNNGTYFLLTKINNDYKTLKINIVR